ncbi:MAG: hypothetical protein WBW33_18835 [Bryobacteraceae bacterium]
MRGYADPNPPRSMHQGQGRFCVALGFAECDADHGRSEQQRPSGWLRQWSSRGKTGVTCPAGTDKLSVVVLKLDNGTYWNSMRTVNLGDHASRKTAASGWSDEPNHDLIFAKSNFQIVDSEGRTITALKIERRRWVGDITDSAGHKVEASTQKQQGK